MFSSRTRTYSGASVVRLMEDDKIPNTVDLSIHESLFSSENLNDLIEENMLESPATKINMYQSYGEEQYWAGVPKSNLIAEEFIYEAIQDVLEKKAGRSIELLYANYGPLNHTHIGWDVLYNELGYNPTTNEIKELSKQTGWPVFLDRIVGLYNEESIEDLGFFEGETITDSNLAPNHSDTLRRWANTMAFGGKTSNTAFDDLIGRNLVKAEAPAEKHPHDAFKIEYVWEEVIEYKGSNATVYIDEYLERYNNHPFLKERVEKQLLKEAEEGKVFTKVKKHTGQKTILLDGYDQDRYYFQGQATYTEGDKTKFIVFTYEEEEGSYPELDQVLRSPERSINKFLPIMWIKDSSIDINGAERTNPYETSDGEIKFNQTQMLANILGLDFKAIHDDIRNNDDDVDIRRASIQFGVPLNTDHQTELRYLYEFFNKLYKVQDNISRTPNIAFGGFERRARGFNVSELDGRPTLFTYQGNITKSLHIGQLSNEKDYEKSFSNFTVNETQLNPTTNEREVVSRTYPGYTIRKQVTSTIYSEINIRQPRMVYQVRGSLDRPRRIHVAEQREDELLIPVDKDIADEFSFFEREEFYYRALHLVFNVTQDVKTRWYESGFFSFVFVVAAIAITVFSAGQAWGALAAAASLGASAFALTLLKMALSSVVIRYAADAIAKELGLEETFLVALIVTAGTFIYSFSTQGFSPNAVKNTPWASEMLVASNALVQSVRTQSEDLMADIEQEMKVLESDAERFEEEIDRVSELLTGPYNFLDPATMVGLRPITIPGESPDLFYIRTVGSGNVGPLSFDAVHNFHDRALRLPDYLDSLGDMNNA